MITISRGYGWIIPGLVMLVFILTQIIFDQIYGDGFYTEHEWPKHTALIIASVIIGVFGCLLNYGRARVDFDPVSGQKIKSPSHTLFFIRFEFWSIIIPMFFLWLYHFMPIQDVDDIFRIKSPVVNDKYFASLSGIHGLDASYGYGILKVVSVHPDGVEVVPSKVTHYRKSGLRGDFAFKKINSAEYYSADSFFMETKYILDLKDRGVIYLVMRASNSLRQDVSVSNKTDTFNQPSN